METINQHVKTYSEWIIKCFATENLQLDYSIDSLKSRVHFLDNNVSNGITKINGILHQDYKEILYGMGIYPGETLKRSLPKAQ